MDASVEDYEWASALAAGDLSAVVRIFNDVWAEWIPGERPMSEAAYVDLDRFTARPERVVRQLVRDDRGQVVGHGQLHWREGPGTCSMHLLVDPDRRRQGFGGALGRSLVDAARAHGRSGVGIGAAAGSVAETVCRATVRLRPDMVEEQNRTDPRAVPDDLLHTWRAAGEATEGYSLVAYDIECPSDELAADFVHARRSMNDAPRWEGEPESTYTVDELRAVEAASLAANQDWWNVGVRHDASGELVGLSEIYLPTARRWIAFQGDTAVDPVHRGHGLGAWMKAVNHLRLNEERPEVEVVQTWNAASNEPMLRINRALGFQAVRRYQGWFLPLP